MKTKNTSKANKTLKTKNTVIKSLLCAGLLSMHTVSEAAVLEFDWTGMFTFLTPDGGALQNGDFATNSTAGSRSEISGTMTYNTLTGAGTATMNPFDLLGSGPTVFHDMNLRAIGDGNGGTGTLIEANMLFDWAGNSNISVDIVWDAGGFFTSGIVDGAGNYTSAYDVGDALVKGPGAVSPFSELPNGRCVFVLAGTYCIVAFDDPATGNTSWILPDDPVPGTLYTAVDGITVVDGGTQFMSTLDGNPFNTTDNVTIVSPGVDGILGTADDAVFSGNRHTDGLSGIQMDNGPFLSLNVNLDIRTMTLTAVPVPAAVWLFGSGLIGLITVAKRKTRA